MATGPPVPRPLPYQVGCNIKWRLTQCCAKYQILISIILVSAQKVSPFYEEWWFLVVIALVGLIFILLLIFILIIRGQSKKYTKKADSGMKHTLNSANISGSLSVCNPGNQVEFVFLLDRSAEHCILMTAASKVYLVKREQKGSHS